MFTANTESLITSTYDDPTGKVTLTVEPNLSNYTNDVGFLTAEVDGSTTNELQNIFQTISVSGQSDVVADGTADALTLVAGTGVSITTNAATDAITITNTGDTNPSDDLTTSTSFSGDVSGLYNNLQIGANTVTFTEMADLQQNRIVARNSTGTGNPEAVTISNVLDWLNNNQGSILYRGATGWAVLVAGTAGDVLTTNGAAANPTWETPAGGSPGGSDTQVQYNNGGSFGGASAMVYDDTDNNLGIGGTPNGAAVFDVISTTEGSRPAPSMTATQREAISGPVDGLQVFNNETSGINYYNGTRWQRVHEASSSPTYTPPTGLGTGSSSSIEGTDLCGKFSITTGTGTLSVANVGSITFDEAFPVGSKYAVFVQVFNSNAEELTGGIIHSTSHSTTGFTFTASATFLSRINGNGSGKTYEWFYRVVQYE